MSPHPGVLDRYCRDLEAAPLLNAAQERALAQEIETLELRHWQALLSYGPALPTVAAAVEAQLDPPVPGLSVLLQGRRRSAPHAMAARLHAADSAREALHAADAAVAAAFEAVPRARRYLERVARAREAEQQKKAHFAAANLRLVIFMARRYARGLIALEDLIQEGNLGLMRAVERFDHRRGHRFSTYATWWIRHAIQRALSNQGRLVRIPVHALEHMARVDQVRKAAQVKDGVSPSSAEVASALGLSEAQVERWGDRTLQAHPLSLDRQLGDEREQTLYDTLPGADAPELDQAVDLAQQGQVLRRHLGRLSGIQADVLRLRFGLDGAEELTLREIGERYNLSRERIRQIETEALHQLREELKGPAVEGERP